MAVSGTRLDHQALMFLRDLRYALRSLARSPGLTAALLATVAVGIGTHAAVGGFVNGLLSHGLAIPTRNGSPPCMHATPRAGTNR
jgi:hypothetical protein